MKRFLCLWLSLLLAISTPAYPQSLTLLGAGSAGSVPPATIVFLGNGSCTVSGTSCTVSGVNFGTADPSRLLIVSTSYISASGTVTGTIGGITATTYVNPTNASNATGLLGITVPTGITGTIVFNFSISPTNVSIPYGIWSITNPVSTTPDNSNGINAGTNCAATVTNVAGGFAVFHAYTTAGSAPGSITGTGVVSDFLTTTNSRGNGGAHASTTGASLTFTSSISSPSSCAAVSFH